MAHLGRWFAAGVLLLSLACAGPDAVWWREGELGRLVCKTDDRMLYEGALIDPATGTALFAVTSPVVVASEDCARFATIDPAGDALRVVERASADGRQLRQATIPYSGSGDLYAQGALIGDSDLVLVGSREAYRLDLSSGRQKWGWEEPRARSRRDPDGIEMQAVFGGGRVGGSWVTACDGRPPREHHPEDESLCVIDLRTGERTEQKGFRASYTRSLGERRVAVMEDDRVRAFDLDKNGRLREVWMVVLSPKPSHVIFSDLKVDGDRLLIGYPSWALVVDVAKGREVARVNVQELSEVALSGDRLLYEDLSGDLRVRNVVTQDDRLVHRLEFCTRDIRPGLCGNFGFEVDVVEPFAVVAGTDRAAGFRLP